MGTGPGGNEGTGPELRANKKSALKPSKSYYSSLTAYLYSQTSEQASCGKVYNSYHQLCVNVKIHIHIHFFFYTDIRKLTEFLVFVDIGNIFSLKTRLYSAFQIIWNL